MKRLTPLAIGLITGIIMLGFTFILYYTHQSPTAPINNLMYVLYAGGIAWAILSYYKYGNYVHKFGAIFGQGFRCFIIVTLIMVAFTGIFSAANPRFAVDDAKNYSEYLEKEVKDKTPAEKTEMVAEFKKSYTTRLVSTAIFGYLILGSVFTAAGAGILLLRRK
jgi:hypothetical protein